MLYLHFFTENDRYNDCHTSPRALTMPKAIPVYWEYLDIFAFPNRRKHDGHIQSLSSQLMYHQENYQYKSEYPVHWYKHQEQYPSRETQELRTDE